MKYSKWKWRISIC